MPKKGQLVLVLVLVLGRLQQRCDCECAAVAALGGGAERRLGYVDDPGE